MFPGVRQIRGGGNANFLHAMTSGSAAFDNGSMFAAAGFDSGLGSIGINFQPWLRTDRQIAPSPANGLNLGLGPLRMYDFVVGAGGFYTDFNSPQGQNDESGWSSAITLGTSVNLDLPILSFQGRLSGYYLPNQDEWGYGLPSPFLSLGFGALGYVEPGIFAALGTKGTVAGWDYFVYDVFNGEFLAIDLTEYLFDGGPRNLGTISASLPSASAIDRVGRYQFGGGYYDRPASATSRVQSPRFASTGGSLINQDRMLFTNSLGAVVGKHLTVTDAIRAYAESKAGKLTKIMDLTQQVSYVLEQG
ncbi:HPF/RaiA family ribosome-associated protein, partial [Zoogloea sp.]|uniref:HPF/RaiA family ribosome-associated protein n=1 Tax=Zoogloea sp. TaxID=49181 RepID=UPI0032209FE6